MGKYEEIERLKKLEFLARNLCKEKDERIAELKIFANGYIKERNEAENKYSALLKRVEEHNKKVASQKNKSFMVYMIADKFEDEFTINTSEVGERCRDSSCSDEIR